MAVRKLKPVTPGQRHKIIGAFDTITASTPEKSLLEPIRKTGGRNNQGRMTMRYIGGGHKRKYRIIDFKRDKDGIAAVVDSIQYDPNRTARIALLQYEDGEKRYVVAPNGLQVGQTIKSGAGIEPEIGNTLPLAEIPLGTWFTTLNYTPDKVVLWLVVQVLMHN
jgi:large subunit ribosomal protein L2